MSAALDRSLALRLIRLCLLVALAPSSTLGDWTEFVPRPVDNGAWIDVFTTWERDRSRAGRSIEWTDTFLKEKLTLGSIGYSYHPKFLQYRFSVAGVASQEDYKSSFRRDRGWRSGTGAEYDTRLSLLPEHFYNLVLFAARYEPLYRERAATLRDAVQNRRGVSFHYRKKPYFLSTNYVNQSTDSGFTSSDVHRLALDGKYFLRTKAGNEFSFNGGFNPSWFSTSQGLEGTSQEYVLGNFVNLQRVRLTSSVVRRFFDQQSRSSQDFETDQFSVYELLNTFLPWNFRSDASYRFRDNESRIGDLATAQSQRLTDRGNDVRVNLVHRLYESLDTGYHFQRDSRKSLGGEITSLFQSVDVNYTKLIPWGRVLTGVNLGTGDTDNRGRADVIDEAHSATLVPGSFRLQQPNVDRRSIAVFLKSPLPPFELVPLVENVHYTVVPAQNSFEIQLLTLPSRFVVPESYDFLVSYSLLGGDFDLRTNTLAQNASVELFDNQVTPYFGYALVRSDVKSGTFPGSYPLDVQRTK